MDDPRIAPDDVPRTWKHPPSGVIYYLPWRNWDVMETGKKAGIYCSRVYPGKRETITKEDPYLGTSWEEAKAHMEKGKFRPVGTQELMEDVFTEIHTLLFNEQYEECNEIIRRWKIWSWFFPPIVGIGVLRAAFPVREKLEKWEVLLAELKMRLGEEDRLLRGLV